jgi:hypothetical protein
MRGYVIENEDCADCDQETGKACIKCTVIERMVKEIAAKWNLSNSREEQRRWGMSREQRDDEREYWGERFDEEAGFAVEKELGREKADALYMTNREEWKARHEVHFDRLWAEHREKEMLHIREREAAEELLERLGARMMRPYEHHNEEERCIEYMETRYDSRDAEEWDY